MTKTDACLHISRPEVVFVSSLLVPYWPQTKTPEKTSVSLASWGTQWRDEKPTLNAVWCLADSACRVLEVWTNKRTESELKE